MRTASGTGDYHEGLSPIYTLPPLHFAYDALEPHIDAATMRLHHQSHH